MGHIIFFLFFIFGLTSTIALMVNETNMTQADLNPSSSCIDSDCSKLTARKGRHIQEFIRLPAPSKKTKRQVIKIPSTVSKVKFVRPPLNLRHNRAPQQFVRYPPNFRSGTVWRPPNKPQTDYDFEVENSSPYDPKKVKRNLKKPKTPEDFYTDEAEVEFEETKQLPKKVKKHRSMVKIRRKKPNHNILGEYLANYEGDVRPNHEGGGLHSSKVRYVGTEESHPFYGYDSAESTIHMKQVQSPNLFPQDTSDTTMDKSLGQFYHDGNYIPALKIKKLPTTGRQIQSMFSQQYTTHNPHVTTNFGLSETFQPKGLQYGMKASFADTTTYGVPHLGKYSQPIADASDLVVTALPVQTPGIQVIQPPQFRDVSISHPSHPSKLVSEQGETSTSQKATIRDILDQDCPAYDVKGYCDSPPRYPTHQIKNIVKKCADLMDAMNTQPFEESQEMHAFSRRIDNHLERSNKSISVNLGLDNRIISLEEALLSNHVSFGIFCCYLYQRRSGEPFPFSSSWSRSATEEFTACNSDVELTEPGYAKEVNSGRWFVIVQHPDTTIQKIATDTCKYPGKHCGGLSELKCVKINGLSGKSTRCVQRHTNQRLISWDPESPEECPRMRVFRFPSACTCHFNVI